MSSPDMSGIWTTYSDPSMRGGRRSPGGKIRVLIVDDHPGYRRSLRSTFELEEDIEVIGEASNGNEATDRAAELKPDLVLMDINMTGLSGMEATRKISQMSPNMPVIILTMFKDQEHLREARRAGASAYVVKDAGTETLLVTIRAVMSGANHLMQGGDTPVPAPQSGSPAQRNTAFDTGRLLTAREREVLRLLGEGKNNAEIAVATNLSESMVATYLAELYRKMGFPGRDAAVEYAREFL